MDILWSSDAPDLSFFTVNANGVFSTTTATSITVTVPDNSTFSFSVSATDKAGNRSATSTVTAEISTTPVVINEIAWAGTGSETTSDEWIELYNRTDRDIDLSGWTLYSETDMKPYIKLSGTIPAKDYYLIERTDDDTVKDVDANLVYSFGSGKGAGLSNEGEVLVLSRASTTMDRTPDIGNGWVGGSDKYYTMEKYDPDLPGEDRSSWTSNNGIITNGRNAEGFPLYGTPRARNGANYFVNREDSSTSSSITLTKENSPYVVKGPLTFKGNAVLDIEPGTVVKFLEDSGLKFTENSKLLAEGTKEGPIVFTSFKDDEYGGDTNGDATSTSPVAGDWYGVSIETGNSGSVISHSVFRFGGWYYSGGRDLGKASLNISDTSADISNSVFERSKAYGLRLSNSSSTVSNSVFRENKSAGITAELGAPEIRRNSFSGNAVGLKLSNSPAIVFSNAFASSEREAIFSNGPTGTFSGNTGSNNGVNGISLSGTLTRKNSTTTVTANEIPYVISSASVAASSTLVVSNGTVFKGYYKGNPLLTVLGKLKIEGENPNDVIFTSSTPVPGSGLRIIVRDNGSLDAKGFTARYMGSTSRRAYGAGAFSFIGTEGRISDALFDSNYPYGILAENSPNLFIGDTTFANHGTQPGFKGKAALGAFNSTTTLSNVLFRENTLGIQSDLASTFSATGVLFDGDNPTTSPEKLKGL